MNKIVSSGGKLILLLFLWKTAFGAKIQFYGDPKYSNLIYTSEVTHKDGCQNFPSEYDNKTKSILNNGACLFIYEAAGCNIYNKGCSRIGGEVVGEFWINSFQPSSFQLCAPPKLIGTNDEKYFFEIRMLMLWNQAEAHCKSLNMKLASITSKAQSNLLKNHFISNNETGWFWTSGTCTDSNCTDIKQFKWHNGAPLDSSYNTIVHKNLNGKLEKTNHLIIHIENNNYHLDRLADYYGGYPLCEIKYNPETNCDFQNDLAMFMFNYN